MNRTANTCPICETRPVDAFGCREVAGGWFCVEYGLQGSHGRTATRNPVDVLLKADPGVQRTASLLSKSEATEQAIRAAWEVSYSAGLNAAQRLAALLQSHPYGAATVALSAQLENDLVPTERDAHARLEDAQAVTVAARLAHHRAVKNAAAGYWDAEANARTARREVTVQ